MMPRWLKASLCRIATGLYGVMLYTETRVGWAFMDLVLFLGFALGAVFYTVAEL